MKRTIYLIAFSLLGLLLQFLFHAIIEMGIITLLTRDFHRYSLGLSWSSWYLLHHILTGLFALGGLLLGYWQGMVWWRIIYVERRWRRRK